MSAAKFLPTSTRMSRAKNIENLYILVYKFIYIYINTYMYINSFDAMRCDAAALFFHIVSLFCKSQILAEKLRKFSQAIFRLHFSEGRGSGSSSSCCSCCSCFARCRCRCGPRSCSWSICQQTECCWHFPRSLTILIYLVF